MGTKPPQSSSPGENPELPPPPPPPKKLGTVSNRTAKLGRREYLKMFCESLTGTYGDTLVEHDTDLHMATALLRRMRKYLFFSSLDMTEIEWIKWRKKFTKTS